MLTGSVRVVALAALLAAWPLPTAAFSPAACPAGAAAMTSAELFFGRFIGDALGVSDEDWARFVDEEATPRFPGGLTVLDVAGQYRGADGKLVKEPSKLLLLFFAADDAAAPVKAAEIAEAYKRRFRQESVLTVLRPVCAAF